ncbi:MAG TPA: crotonase/enoyl-CoA hydratase family protein [Thermohalobaculum sp.]|nr:crotonase/enoyl-CoA hydratase family protein [Thermohalobaculum sp.]
MSYETISISRDARGVATLTLNRPEKHNAMNARLIAELAAAAAALGADAALRAVVLTGAGKSFSAGADLNWMREQTQATREERIEQASGLARALKALNELPKPLIGRINGQAYGGGMGLMAVCDVAVAAHGAKFGFTEARLGLIPATISPYVVARMGLARAREVFASARLFEAEEAVRLGLAARAVAADDLDAAVEAEITPYLAAAPGAVAASKALLFRLRPTADDATIALTAGLLADQWESEEARTGIAAFLERRPMPWAGD